MQRSRAYAAIVLACAVALVGTAVVIFVYGSSFEMRPRTTLAVGTALSILAFLGVVISFAIRLLRHAQHGLREQEERVRARAQRATKRVQDATDLNQLVEANRAQMVAYDELARLQSRESFRNSQIAIAVGLTALVVGAAVAIATPTPMAKITTTTLTALAAMLSGYISRTFLRVYERTQRQLTFFFQQPLINSWLLNAERIVDRMTAEKDQQYARVVERVMEILVQLPRVWELEQPGGQRGARARRSRTPETAGQR